MDPEERYLEDQEFHALVDIMNKAIQEAHYTPTEMRQAAILACLKYEQSRPRLNLQGEGVVGRMKLSDVLKVWDILHVMDTGSMGFCDLEKAIDQVVGTENDICPSYPSAPNSIGTTDAPIKADQTP